MTRKCLDQMSDNNKINDPFKKTHRSAVSVEGFPYSMNALKNAREGEGGAFLIFNQPGLKTGVGSDLSGRQSTKVRTYAYEQGQRDTGT